jgi:hypothetical protein
LRAGGNEQATGAIESERERGPPMQLRCPLFPTLSSPGIVSFTRTDAAGEPLDGSKQKYTLTFAAGQYPPVNTFWSVTMYDGNSQLLIKNPINRYLINSPMLTDTKKNMDCSNWTGYQRSE